MIWQIYMAYQTGSLDRRHVVISITARTCETWCTPATGSTRTDTVLKRPVHWFHDSHLMPFCETSKSRKYIVDLRI